jgi:hypothetical protein
MFGTFWGRQTATKGKVTAAVSRLLFSINFLFIYFMGLQGVSEIRVLILMNGRTRQFMELLSITVLRKSITNGFKIWNKLAIKVYIRLEVRTKIFCCDRNGSF